MLRTSVFVIAVVSSMGHVGCATPHVNLRAPDPRAALQERLEAYDQLQPMSYEQMTLVYQSGATRDMGPGAMLLASGDQVFDAMDLLPVIEPGSTTARAAERSIEIFDRGRNIALVGIAFIAAGLVSGGIALAADDGTIPAVIGAGLFTTGIVISLVNGGYGDEVQEQRRIAFESYGDDLREHLRLCPGPNETLVDCPTTDTTTPVELTRSHLPSHPAF